MRRVRPYHYVRFNWFKEVDLKKVDGELSGNFEVKMVRIPWNDLEISIGDDMSEELRKIMIELYQRERPTHFPFMFGRESSYRGSRTVMESK